MRGFRENVHPVEGRSFVATLAYLQELNFGLHHHPHYELAAFEGASGVRVVGDHIEEFSGGDIQLIPSNLPHDCRFTRPDEDQSEVALHVVKFILSDWQELLELPDMNHVRRLLVGNRGGYQILPPNKKWFFAKLQEMQNASPGGALGLLLELFSYIAEECELRGLSQVELSVETRGNERLSRVSDYLQKNFRQTMTLQDVATVAHLTPVAFSRFFSHTMGRPFSRYLNEVRISYACSRLLDSDDTVLSIALDAGYESLTNFNRRFKQLRGMTPREYRRQHQSASAPQ